MASPISSKFSMRVTIDMTVVRSFSDDTAVCPWRHMGQLSLASPGMAKSSTSFGWGNGGNVTGWQVTLCDLIWHVSSRSGEASC